MFEEFRKDKLFQSLGPITVVCVRRFLATEEQERSRVQERHLHKLRLLGLHDNKRVEGTLHNFSSKQLTQAETEILARGLDYCFYTRRLNLLKIKVEFEKTYSEIMRHLAPKHILDFKLKMLNLYNSKPASHKTHMVYTISSCSKTYCRMQSRDGRSHFFILRSA